MNTNFLYKALSLVISCVTIYSCTVKEPFEYDEDDPVTNKYDKDDPVANEDDENDPITNDNILSRITIVEDNIPVDLGLESGTKWSSMNLGAASNTDTGDYYCWGETTPHDGNSVSHSKYYYLDLPNSIEGSQYDAATNQLGEGWSIPTKEEFDELQKSCKYTHVLYHNKKGIVFYNEKTEKGIFFPITGFYLDRSSTSITYPESGYYWTSKKNTTLMIFIHEDTQNGWYKPLELKYSILSETRQCIRPVYKP